MAEITQYALVDNNGTLSSRGFTVSATASGAALVLGVTVDNPSNTVAGITDSAGNSWTILSAYTAGSVTIQYAYCLDALSVTTITPTLTTGDQTAIAFWELSTDFDTFVAVSAGANASTTTPARDTVSITAKSSAVLGVVSNSTNSRPLAVTTADVSAGWIDMGYKEVGTSMTTDAGHRIISNLPGAAGPQFYQTSGSAVSTSTQTIAFEASSPELGANFSATPLSGYGSTSVSFTGISATATTWSWDFGDGGTSAVQNPTHVYDTPGDYTVSLTVGDGTNTYTRTRTDYIHINPPISSPTTTFDGTALTGNWHLDDPNNVGGTVTVGGGVAVVHHPAASTDSIYGSSPNDTSVGLATPIPTHGGDIDIAVQIITDLTDQKGIGINILAFGTDDSEGVRFSIYHGDSTGWGVKYFSYSQAGGSGATGANVDFSRYMSGLGNWLRIAYDASLSLWTFYTSSDGVEWTTKTTRDLSGADMTITRAFTPQVFKIGFHTSAATPVAFDASISQVVDLIERGNTDLRSSIPGANKSLVSNIAGSAGTLPAGWTNISSGTDTLTWTGSALRLNHDASQNADFGAARAAFRWTTDTRADWGIFVRVANPTPNASCYLTIGAGLDQGGLDQYSWGAGYALEVQSGSIRRPIRVDDPTDAQVTEAPSQSSTALDETAYCHLAQRTSASPINSDGLIHCIRLERFKTRYRVKEWLDGAPEPATWNYFDGQDETIMSALAPSISLSHNGTKSGTCVFDFYEIQYYSLSAITGKRILEVVNDSYASLAALSGDASGQALYDHWVAAGHGVTLVGHTATPANLATDYDIVWLTNSCPTAMDLTTPGYATTGLPVVGTGVRSPHPSYASVSATDSTTQTTIYVKNQGIGDPTVPADITTAQTVTILDTAFMSRYIEDIRLGSGHHQIASRNSTNLNNLLFTRYDSGDMMYGDVPAPSKRAWFLCHPGSIGANVRGWEFMDLLLVWATATTTTTPQAYVWDGTAWVAQSSIQVWDGTTWVDKSFQRWNGSGWS